MIFGRRRKQIKADLEEARAIRQQSEAALHRDTERVKIPLREIRERNHVAEDILKMRTVLIKRGGKGEPGTAAR